MKSLKKPQYLQGSECKPWFAAAPGDAHWGLIWGFKALQKQSKKAFDTLFEPHLSKIWFLKDVLNEITTFASLEVAKRGPKYPQGSSESI